MFWDFNIPYSSRYCLPLYCPLVCSFSICVTFSVDRENWDLARTSNEINTLAFVFNLYLILCFLYVNRQKNPQFGLAGNNG